MPELSDLYFNSNSAMQCNNVGIFLEIAKRYTWMNFKQPAKALSPWHFQGYIPCVSGGNIVVNFWPHKGKAQREDCKTVTGYDAIRRMITEAIDDSQDDFEVIE